MSYNLNNCRSISVSVLDRVGKRVQPQIAGLLILNTFEDIEIQELLKVNDARKRKQLAEQFEL